MNNDFKTAINTFGRMLNGKITVGENVYDNDDNVYIKPRFNVDLFKTIMPAVDFETTVKISSQQWVKIEIGVLVDDEYEYVDFGDYYINEEPEWNMDTLSWTYIAYGKMIESMMPYQELDVEYPITYKNYLIAICDYLGWEYDLDDTFPNEDSLIQRDLWKDLSLTWRDVLDDLSPLSMGNFYHDGEKFKILYPQDTGDVVDEDWLNENNTTLFDTIKPINSLVLSRAEGGDKIFRSDIGEEEEISEIEIKDNIILSSEYREDYIDEMFNFIKGFSYTPFEIETVGTLWFKPLDKFIIQKEGINYETILLNYEIDYSDGLKELMFSPILEQSVSNYKTSALTDRAIKMANILAYKNDARIELLTRDLESTQERTSNIELNVDGIISEVERIDPLEERVSTVEQTADGIEFSFREKTKNPNLMENSSGFFGLQGVYNYISKKIMVWKNTELGNFSPYSTSYNNRPIAYFVIEDDYPRNLNGFRYTLWRRIFDGEQVLGEGNRTYELVGRINETTGEIFVGTLACLVGNTKIKTKAGYVPISDLKIGDMILTLEKEEPIIKKYSHKETILYLITTEDEMVEATHSHIFITNFGEKTSKELKVGDYLKTRTGFRKIDNIVIKRLPNPVKVYEIKTKSGLYLCGKYDVINKSENI